MQDLTGRHRAVQDVMRHFTYDHLPPNLQAVSRPVCELAHHMLEVIPADDPELTRGLHRLLEAKDALVRAALPPKEGS